MSVPTTSADHHFAAVIGRLDSETRSRFLEAEECRGYELAKAVRTRFPERHLTIIALTGWGQPEDRRKAQAAGIDHYLVKPLQFATLRALLPKNVRVQRPAAV